MKRCSYVCLKLSDNAERESPGLVSIPSTSNVLPNSEAPEEIEKLITSYRNYCSTEKAFFKLQNNADIFDMNDEPIPVTEELLSKLEIASGKMIANILVEDFKVFRNLNREEKYVVFGPIASRWMAFFSGVFTGNSFPEENNKKALRHYGFYVNLDEPLKLFGKVINKMESIVALLRPIHSKVFDAAKKLAKLRISETELVCLLALIVYNQSKFVFIFRSSYIYNYSINLISVELMGFQKEECARMREKVTKYLQSELFSTYGTSEGGLRFAEILTLQLNCEVSFKFSRNIQFYVHLTFR